MGKKYGRVFQSLCKLYGEILFYFIPIKVFCQAFFQKSRVFLLRLSPVLPLRHSVLSGKIYELAAVIIIGGLIAAESAAFAAFVGDNKTALGVGFGGHGVHYAAAVCRAVSRIHVEVEGA